VIAGAVGSIAALAGCSGGESDGGAGADGGPSAAATTNEPATTAASAAATTTGSAAAEDLDLREANVTAVGVERTDRGYRFSVTLYHDDDGEDGYANWWQVETPGGERLGRRELLHAHGTREFTRSATVSVPDGVTAVVVRGHDQEHGYGGQAALVDLDGGSVELVRQGSGSRPIGE
jgi:hypothetical protein